MQLDKYVTREEQAFYRFEQILIENKLLPRSAQEDTAILATLRLMVSDSRSAKTLPLDKLAFRLPHVLQEFGPVGRTYQ